jgi:broad specificity phosphatase PhoE
MKILFVRHGEAQDDILNAYGGWADHKLTPKGKTQIEATAKKIEALDTEFEVILTSPLNRAKSSAEILSKKLDIPTETLEYLKERNKYGVLSGMIKEKAKVKYPNQVEKYENDKWVDASEKLVDFEKRVLKSFEMLFNRKEKNIIAVTHGGYLKAMARLLLKSKITKKEDAGMILIEVGDEKVKVLEQMGIEVS